MKKCSFCQTPNAEDLLFCSECGTFLQDASLRGTDPLLGYWSDEVGAPLLSQERAPVAILLSIGEKGRQVVLPLEQPLYLGRLDAANYNFPEVDLAEDGGASLGVSRRHAKLLKREAFVVIEDLGSLNGTSVNGRRLAPFMPEVLAHGDYLQLGRLTLQLFFEDEEGIFQKRPELSPQARQEDLEQRLAHLFELYEGGLCYLEWIPLESNPASQAITRLLGELLPLPHLGATLMGRYPDVGLQLSSRKVSGHHCRIFYEDYQFFVEDLGSTNGTFVNKIRLAPHTKQPLHHDDSLRVGDVQLFFRDRLVAFLAELKSPIERQMVVERIRIRAGREFEAALYILARLLHTWIDKAEANLVDATVLLIYTLLEAEPLQGLDLVLKVTQPGKRRVHERVYWALSRWLAGPIETFPRTLELVVRLAGEHPLALLHWIALATPPGPFRTFFEVGEDLFASGDYTRPDLQRLVGNLKYLSEGVEPQNRLALYGVLFELLNHRTVSEIAVFSPPPFVKEAETPPAEVIAWLRRLAAVSEVIQQVILAIELKDKLAYLAAALPLLNALKQETAPRSQKPELTLYSEILFRWRWLIISEQERLRGDEHVAQES